MPMKTLLLMRHAKSSWDEKDQDDYDRPLSKRGKKNAPHMGEMLKDEKIMPDVILASAAVRTRQTAELLMEELKYRGDICYLNSLYLAEVETYVKEVQRIPDEMNCAMIIGHNPGLESLLQMTTGKVESLPTAAVAYLKLPVVIWAEFTAQTPAELVHLWRPKDR